MYFINTTFYSYVLPAFLALIALPSIVFAQDKPTFKSIVTGTLFPLFDAMIGFIMVLAVLVFIVGVVRFMYSAGNDKSRESGKSMLVWGTLALFLLVSVWGVVKIIKVTFFG